MICYSNLELTLLLPYLLLLLLFELHLYLYFISALQYTNPHIYIPDYLTPGLSPQAPLGREVLLVGPLCVKEWIKVKFG